jgi:hypothetical protein
MAKTKAKGKKKLPEVTELQRILIARYKTNEALLFMFNSLGSDERKKIFELTKDLSKKAVRKWKRFVPA